MTRSDINRLLFDGSWLGFWPLYLNSEEEKQS
jgi:hypothetical protein